MTNIHLDTLCYKYWFGNNDYYGIYDKDKFSKLFFPFYEVNEVNKVNNEINNKQNVIVYDAHWGITPGHNINNNNMNILLCIENCNYWKHYKHYNIYGDYGNDKIKIYLYNHVTRLKITESYIVIPVIYLFINYYKKYNNIIQPTIITPFNEKLFCLIVSFNKRNEQDAMAMNFLISKIQNIGHCDSIKNIKVKGSAYFTTDLLNLFNRYKFIICFENSISDGYITEKPFNVIFAHSIPIYYGPSDRYRYFNKDSFIDVRETDFNTILNKIISIKDNEELFNSYINKSFINKDFDDENFIQEAQKFINK